MKRAGFTLVETLMALMITSLILVTGHQSFKVADLRAETERIRWHQLLLKIESSDLKMAVQQVRPHQLTLYSQSAKKDYHLLVDPHHILKMTGAHGQGYMPLMTGVKALDLAVLNPHQFLLKVETGHNKIYQATCTLKKWQGDHETKR